MLFLGSFTRMKWRQLFWITLCVVELAVNASGSPTDTPTPTTMNMEGNSSRAATGATGTIGATGATATASSARTTVDTSAAAGSPTANPSSPGLSREQTSPQTSRAPTQPLGTSSETQHTSQGVSTAKSPVAQPSEAAEASGSTVALSSSPETPEHPSVSAATTPLHTSRESPKLSLLPITCHNVKELNDTRAICLQLNKSTTCKHFVERKGLDLQKAICEENQHLSSPCRIKLAKSEVNQDCILLVLDEERDHALNMIKESHWEKFGIKFLKQDSVRNHQDFSQKTLIALVTSGLLLAFLGLAGYFLMKRRSWSPAGERLAEDPYYTENGSQGNTMLMTPSQEQPELQEKPNLNGGTQENGTGQASSKNGHSARQHSPADTEM